MKESVEFLSHAKRGRGQECTNDVALQQEIVINIFFRGREKGSCEINLLRIIGIGKQIISFVVHSRAADEAEDDDKRQGGDANREWGWNSNWITSKFIDKRTSKTISVFSSGVELVLRNHLLGHKAMMTRIWQVNYQLGPSTIYNANYFAGTWDWFIVLLRFIVVVGGLIKRNSFVFNNTPQRPLLSVHLSMTNVC